MIKSILFIFLLVISASSAFAQVTELVVTPPASKGGINKIQLLQNSSDSAQSQAQGVTATDTNKQLMADRFIKRADAFIIRLDSINHKLATKIDKVAQKPLNVSSFQKQQVDIQSKIDKLKKQAESMKQSLAVLLSTSNPQIDYPSFRQQLVQFSFDVTQVRTMQKDLINALRQANSTASSPKQ